MNQPNTDKQNVEKEMVMLIEKYLTKPLKGLVTTIVLNTKIGQVDGKILDVVAQSLLLFLILK